MVIFSGRVELTWSSIKDDCWGPVRDIRILVPWELMAKMREHWPGSPKLSLTPLNLGHWPCLGRNFLFSAKFFIVLGTWLEPCYQILWLWGTWRPRELRTRWNFETWGIWEHRRLGDLGTWTLSTVKPQPSPGCPGNSVTSQLGSHACFNGRDRCWKETWKVGYKLWPESLSRGRKHRQWKGRLFI